VIAGANIAFTKRLSSLLIFDGVHFHTTVSYFHGRHGVSLLLVRSKDPGVSYSLRF